MDQSPRPVDDDRDLTSSAATRTLRTIGDSTIGAFAITRAVLSLIVIGGFLLRADSFTSSDLALTSLGFVLIACVGLASASVTLVRRWRRLDLMDSRPWNAILIDSALAIGVMTSIDATTSPLAWIALIVPVVETAVFFSMIPAAIVWLGLSVAFLALRLTTGDDVGGDALALAVQQVLAVFLVSGPAALLADSASHRITQLTDARRSADEMADRLQRIASAANDMSQENTVESVLASVSRNAITIGFDHADIVVHDGAMWQSMYTNTTGRFRTPPADYLADVGTDAIAAAAHDDPGHRQSLHEFRLASGHAVRIDDGEKSADRAVLRVWREHRPASEQLVRSLELLVGHAREIHRTASLLAAARDHSDQLLHQVRHDSLTGIANRAFVISSVEQHIEQGTKMALYFVDLDGFKTINDTLGHRAGDVALTTVADRLSRRISAAALAGRMGGDEFIVITPVTAFDTRASLELLGTELVELISEPMIIDGQRAQLGASIGLAVHATGETTDGVISRADSAMYEAKRAGGGLVVSTGPQLRADTTAGAS